MSKHIENAPISVNYGFINDSKQPVIPYSADVYETSCVESHMHPRAQLIYSTKGVMKVYIDKYIWLVSPRQAIWVPPMVAHQVHFLKENHVRNLFVDSSVTKNLPNECFAFEVSIFLRELIIKIINNGVSNVLNSPAHRLVNVLLDELSTITPSKYFIPISNESHVVKVIDSLLKNPGDKRTINEYADLACVSIRTLIRLFNKEVGMSFSNWRKQLRIVTAIELLSKGLSVSQVSFDLGYNSPSAFIEMFRKEFGLPPNKYIESI